MTKRGLIPVVLITLMVVISAFIPVSAQDVDTSNMSSEDIMMLMMTMLQQMQQGNAKDSTEPTATPVPTATSQPAASGSSDELLMQMLQMLQQMQQENAESNSEPTATPVPTATPQPDVPGSSDELLMQMYLMLQQMQQNQTNAAGMTSKAEENDTAEEVFHIYKNKKLILERIPDDRFIQHEKTAEPENKDKEKPVPTSEDHVCPPDTYWVDFLEKCTTLG